MYEIFTLPIKKKKDLFTLKKMSVRYKKAWTAQRISTNFPVLVSTVITNSENVSICRGSNWKNLFRWISIISVGSWTTLLQRSVLKICTLKYWYSLKVFWYVTYSNKLKGWVFPIYVLKKEKFEFETMKTFSRFQFEKSYLIVKSLITLPMKLCMGMSFSFFV